MNEYEKLLQKILAPFDLSQPGQIDRAYETCVDYARRNLLNDPNCNDFLLLASQKLETIPVHLDTIGLTTPMSPESRLDLYVSDENEVVLSGNREGLSYLIDLLNKLKDEEPSEHFHLDPGEAPLTRRSWPFIVYREEHPWFDEQDTHPIEALGLPDRSTLDPGQVVAIQFLDFPPAHLKLASQKLYKIGVSVGPNVSESPHRIPSKAWEKHYEGGAEGRYHEFALVNDAQVPVKVRLHLDDPGVQFFQRSDLANLL